MDKIKIKNPLIILLTFPIKFYQFFISPLIGINCRFVPTCSEYCLESLKKFGLIKGIYLSFTRLKKCHPFGESGYDPVTREILFKKVNLQDISKLRRESLYQDLPKRLSTYNEDHYKNTEHFALFIDKQIVSGLTIVRRKNNKETLDSFVQLRGMFTISKEYGKGYGSILINMLVKNLEKKKIKFIWCNSRIKAVNFYEKNNFKKVGNKFDIKLIGQHIKLIRYI